MAAKHNSYVIFNNYHKIVLDNILSKNKAFVNKLFDELVHATPVDTGLARASWQVGRRGFEGKVLNPGHHDIPPLPNLSFMNNRRQVDIKNTAKHTIFLNEGHSQQAPSKFIEKTVDRVTRNFK